MIIRKPIFQDEPEVLRMGRAFFDQTILGNFSKFDDETFLNTVRNLNTNEDMSMWVAEEDGKLVGMIGGVIYPFFFGSDKVAQEVFWWSERNAGSDLQGIFEAWAKVRGAKVLSMLSIENGRRPAVDKLYKKNGFVPLEHTFIRSL